MRGRLRVVLALSFALLGGAGVAVQALLVGDVADVYGPLPTTLSMFFAGAAVLTLAVMAAPRDRAAVARIPVLVRTGALRIVDVANGVAGAATVVVQGLTVGVLGVALFTMGFVCGQAVGGAAFDASGASGRRIPLTALRVAGGVLTIVAVGLGASQSGFSGGTVPPVLLAALSGVVGAWTGAASARVHAGVGRIVSAAWINFIGGLVVLALICAAAGLLPSAFAALIDWRLLPAAALGIAAISATTLLVPRLGVLALAICWIGGQLGAGIAIDALRDGDVPWTLGAGAVIIVLALTMTAVDEARRDQDAGRIAE